MMLEERNCVHGRREGNETDAKAFLKQYKKLDKLIENKLIEIRRLKEIAENTATGTGGDRVQSSHNPHKIADAIGKYIDLEREIREDIEKLIDAKKDVVSVIEQLKATEYDVLHKMYIQGLSYWDVAEKYDRTYSWATKVHGRAVKHVQDILNARG